MKPPSLDPSWPKAWQASYKYDLLEVYGQPQRHPGYAYAYRNRQRATLELVGKAARSGCSILDIAAAQGNFSLLLAEAGYEVTWNDLREVLIGYVRITARLPGFLRRRLLAHMAVLFRRPATD